MRGKDEQQLDVFSYISPEQRVPQDQRGRTENRPRLMKKTWSRVTHAQPSGGLGRLVMSGEGGSLYFFFQSSFFGSVPAVCILAS
jgi:hypothetical protein